MNRAKNVVLASILVIAAMYSTRGFAQSTEERFHDLFVTAGYSTAFGAALGAACLSFFPEPETQLRYVAVGASLGFIGGSIMGSYIIFAPMFTANDTGSKQTQWASDAPIPSRGLMIRPTFDKQAQVARVEAGYTFLTF